MRTVVFFPGEYLTALYDEGLARDASDEEVREYLIEDGRDPDSAYCIQVFSAHSARRYELLTGEPF